MPPYCTEPKIRNPPKSTKNLVLEVSAKTSPRECESPLTIDDDGIEKIAKSHKAPKFCLNTKADAPKAHNRLQTPTARIAQNRADAM